MDSDKNEWIITRTNNGVERSSFFAQTFQQNQFVVGIRTSKETNRCYLEIKTKK